MTGRDDRLPLAVREGLVELHREGMGEINVFARRDVHANVAPFLGREVGEARSISASPVETIWMTAAWPASDHG